MSCLFKVVFFVQEFPEIIIIIIKKHKSVISGNLLEMYVLNWKNRTLKFKQRLGVLVNA